MPYHKLLDHAGEAQLGKLQIGTTRRGIGPCYADKAARLGIRMQDLLDEKILRKKIYTALDAQAADAAAVRQGPRARPARDDRGVPHPRPPARALHRRHPADRLARARRAGLVVFEGAQGALLDIDHGTYPFVTSSNTVAGAACAGAGVGPRSIDEVWGIAKAYATRVGAGPFPTELDDALGERIREAGGEFGTTTGRPRRTGWIDLVALRYATRINGLTGLVLTKLDVLTGIDPLYVGVRYLGPEGATFDEFPYHQSIVHKVDGRPRRAARLARGHLGRALDRRLPANAQSYLDFISDFLGVPVVMVGVGPGARRDDLDRRGRARAAAAPRPSQAFTTWVETTMSCRARFWSSHSGHR